MAIVWLWARTARSLADLTVDETGRISLNAIAVDRKGKPHICYMYMTNDNEYVLKYARME